LDKYINKLKSKDKNKQEQYYDSLKHDINTKNDSSNKPEKKEPEPNKAVKIDTISYSIKPSVPNLNLTKNDCITSNNKLDSTENKPETPKTVVKKEDVIPHITTNNTINSDIKPKSEYSDPFADSIGNDVNDDPFK